ncbi:EmrB/QacA subfamily drug resistance transporter [Microvirga flocculans]|uniref:EmrB/QacA subfamily drug resistance transporter n=1 Tax=Microvirga flocculans TaxID=217168 RepID=A0A7W6IC62_9HYPH|nr:MDR family MFS transporter [Microvirga flocculans]MBB4038753.1 EmrB/QacA subfamily drug resistance transporter [Microvirga flocculans]
MDQSPTAHPESGQSKALSHAEIRTIIVGVLLAMFLAALDQTIIATALPTIGRELGDLEHISWIVTVYLLTSTAVTPLYGKLSDSYGRRIIMLIGIVVFIIGSIACALAPSMVVLILARALQGIGGGGLIALAQTIIADIVPPRERGRYQVYFASVFLSSSLLGPVLGGFFAEKMHWSVIFWINLPLGLTAFALAYRSLKKLPRHERPHRLDLLGAVLLVAATVALLLALSWGGLRYPWASLPILGLIALSMLLWGLFAARMRLAPEPLIPPGVLHNPVVRMATLSACFGMGTYIGLTIYLPVYFEAVRGLSASLSGLALIPLMAGTVVGATLSGRTMARVAHYKRLPTAGLAVAMAATGLLAFYGQSLSILAVEGVLAVISIGLGTLLPVSMVATQNAVAPHQMGTATGTANFFRSLGGAFIVAIFGAIVLSGSGLNGATSFEGLSKVAARSGIDLAGVFSHVFMAAIAGFGLALAFLLALEERPLRGSAVKAAEAAVAD